MGAAGQTRRLSSGTGQASPTPTRPIYTHCTRLIVIFRARLPTVQLVPITAIRLGPCPGSLFLWQVRGQLNAQPSCLSGSRKNGLGFPRIHTFGRDTTTASPLRGHGVLRGGLL